MTEVILFPDLEAAVIDYLTGELAAFDADATVDNTVPDPRPTRLVRVLRTGGARTGVVLEDAQLTIDCWDVLVEDAHDLAQLCRGLMTAMPYRYPDTVTYRVHEVGGPNNQPDPDTASPRYTFTVLITARGTAIAEPS